MDQHLWPIEIIVAVANNNVIGNKNELPWGHQSMDLKHFKWITGKGIVVVGFNTLQSISRKLGRRHDLLPGRLIYVLTRTPHKVISQYPNCFPVSDVESVLRLRKLNRVLIAGGQQVYEQFLSLPEVRIIHMTRFYGDFHGDTHFSQLPSQEWRVLKNDFHEANKEHNSPALSFITLGRV